MEKLIKTYYIEKELLVLYDNLQNLKKESDSWNFKSIKYVYIKLRMMKYLSISSLYLIHNFNTTVMTHTLVPKNC